MNGLGGMLICGVPTAGCVLFASCAGGNNKSRRSLSLMVAMRLLNLCIRELCSRR